MRRSNGNGVGSGRDGLDAVRGSGIEGGIDIQRDDFARWTHGKILARYFAYPWISALPPPETRQPVSPTFDRIPPCTHTIVCC